MYIIQLFVGCLCCVCDAFCCVELLSLLLVLHSPCCQHEFCEFALHIRSEIEQLTLPKYDFDQPFISIAVCSYRDIIDTINDRLWSDTL